MKKEIDCLLIGYTYNNPMLLNNVLSELNPNLKTLERPFNAAVAYLGTYLNRRELTFDYISYADGEQELLNAKLNEHNYKCIGISTTFCESINQITNIVGLIKKFDPDMKVILGGSYISAHTKQIIDGGDALLQRMFRKIKADFIIESFYGEDSLAKIINSLKNNLEFSNIPNIYYNFENKFVYTYYKEEHINLDENTADWGLFSDKVGTIIPVRTSISCPFSCSFCNYPLNAGKHKYASIEAIEKELNEIERIGKIKTIQFVDNNFNVPNDRFKDILRMMIKNKYSFKWYTYMRCQYLDRETVELMKESGCAGVLLGIESANQEMLNRMNKQAEVSSYREAIALLNEYGILSFALCIIGFPGETISSINETVSFIDETKPTFYFLEVWFYDPRTPIRLESEKYQISGSYLAWNHKTMDVHTANKLRDKAVAEIKNSTPLLTNYTQVFQLLNLGFDVSEIRNAFSNVISSGLLR